MTAASSHERIHEIGKKIGSINRYLEVGVAKGDTFFNVNAREKHAVDPRFRFNPSVRRNHKHEFYHPVTSDEYFANAVQSNINFDLIFLDGLHTFDQTLRDFISSLALCHPNTIWLIDDTVPTDAIAADPNLNKVREARSIINKSDDETWMGDVYKVIVFIDCFSLNIHVSH